MVSRYQKRISGPLLDRIDTRSASRSRASSTRSCRTTGWGTLGGIRSRVAAARERQRHRFAETALLTNADMGPAEVREYCPLDDAGRSLLRAAMQQLQMSAWAYHRILRLARTIADLAGSERIQTVHLAEAIQYRPRRQT
jgi:magnesium chelatase family protein